MVNELRDLLHANVASPPHDTVDLSAVLQGGRRRVRRRRIAAAGGTAAACAAVIGLTSLVWPSPPDLDAAGVPTPDGRALHLAGAQEALPGVDYRVLASHTNADLEADNGQYFDGVTEDGLILFRDGPRADLLRARYALLDPATGAKAWLAAPPLPEAGQLWPVDLGRQQLVLTGLRHGPGGQARLLALVYDRTAQQWSRLDWPGLPALDGPGSETLGPDGRLYVRVPATEGKPPAGGWPTGPDGEADDADAAGDTYRLWSVSLTDPADVRDEGLTVGSVVFTDTSMVWTDSTNGDSGRVHLRNLATGDERAFDPRSGARCNLLSFGATDDRIVMGQYCGTYAGGVRDDRVQILSTAGEPVVTLQDSSIDGALAGDSGVVTVTSYQRGRSGTYVYVLGTDRFLRVSRGVSQWSTHGPTPEGRFMWTSPAGRGDGATYRLGELLE